MARFVRSSSHSGEAAMGVKAGRPRTPRIRGSRSSRTLRLYIDADGMPTASRSPWQATREKGPSQRKHELKQERRRGAYVRQATSAQHPNAHSRACETSFYLPQEIMAAQS
eukprot:1278087-Heterocapsa_arctica.AAC.1